MSRGTPPGGSARGSKRNRYDKAYGGAKRDDKGRVEKDTPRRDNGPAETEPPPPWPELILLADYPEAPPFPVEVLPEPLRRFVREAARALPCPPDFVGHPLVVPAGAAIGGTLTLEIKPGHV